MRTMIHGSHVSRTISDAFHEAGVTCREWGVLSGQLWAELAAVIYGIHRQACTENKTGPDAPAYLELRALVLEFIRLNRPAAGTPARAAFDRRVEEFHEWCRGEREAMGGVSTRIRASPGRGRRRRS